MKICSVYKNISSYIKKTPLEYNKRLSTKYNCNIYLKREDLQICRSFKIRGALNKILNLSEIEKHNGIVCASAGNHAQGVAYSANILNIESDIFLPNTTPKQKINKIKNIKNIKNKGIHITGSTFNECLEEALLFSEKENKTFIHPYNDINIIKGQGTIGIELFDNDNNITPNIIISAIGGGGLMSGLILHRNENNLLSKYIGVEPKGCPSMQASIELNKIQSIIPEDNFVDGATVGTVGDITFDICKSQLDFIYNVENGKLCETMIELYQDDGIITEPAGALSVSVLDKIDPDLIYGKNVVCILSGGNNDITRYPEILDKCLQYQGLKVFYIINFIQKPGQLRQFVNNILTEKSDIIQFEYMKKTNKGFGDVLIGIELENAEDSKYIEQNMEEKMYNFIKINSDNQLYSYLI
jgi:threonine dehydratase